jgi:hypothetical protein
VTDERDLFAGLDPTHALLCHASDLLSPGAGPLPDETDDDTRWRLLDVHYGAFGDRLIRDVLLASGTTGDDVDLLIAALRRRRAES